MKHLKCLFLLLALTTQAYADESERPVVQFEQYRPNYFIIGNPNLKIQFSFKAKLFGDDLYMGYTQRIFWDVLYVESAPVLDTIYNPEAFYRFHSQAKSEKDTWLDLGLIEHESNGLAGYGSRSWNRTYLRYHSVLPLTGSKDPAKLYWSLKAWVPYVVDLQTTDYINYRGLYDFDLTFANFLGERLKETDLNFRINGGGKSWVNPLQGSQEVTLRIHHDFQKFTPSFFIQMFHGYGETMLNYNRNTFGLRGGIGF